LECLSIRELCFNLDLVPVAPAVQSRDQRSLAAVDRLDVGAIGTREKT
jgi:hypothetical protein